MLDWKEKLPNKKIFLKMIEKLKQIGYIEINSEVDLQKIHKFLHQFFNNKLLASESILKQADSELRKWLPRVYQDINEKELNSIYRAGLAYISLVYIVYTFQLFPGDELINKAQKYYKKRKFYKFKIVKNFEFFQEQEMASQTSVNDKE